MHQQQQSRHRGVHRLDSYLLSAAPQLEQSCRCRMAGSDQSQPDSARLMALLRIGAGNPGHRYRPIRPSALTNAFGQRHGGLRRDRSSRLQNVLAHPTQEVLQRRRIDHSTAEKDLGSAGNSCDRRTDESTGERLRSRNGLAATEEPGDELSRGGLRRHRIAGWPSADAKRR